MASTIRDLGNLSTVWGRDIICHLESMSLNPECGENQVGRSRPFWDHWYGAAQEHFNSLQDVSLDDFYFAINHVEPSLIRVEADELTYNLHIIIRFELEQALIDEQIKPADLPEAWNTKYQQYLGIQPPTDADGVMQDVHWSCRIGRILPNLFAWQSICCPILSAGR